MKKDLFWFYWKAYGTKQIMNNEFMIWFVKGYVAHKKGEKVNQARAAASTSQEKTHRKEIKLIKSGPTNLFGKANGGEGFCEFDYKFYRLEQTNAAIGFDRETTICPYGVSPIELARMTKIHGSRFA